MQEPVYNSTRCCWPGLEIKETVRTTSLSLSTQKKEDAVPLYVNTEVDDARVHLRLYKAVATFLSHWSVVSTSVVETFETLASSESPLKFGLLCSLRFKFLFFVSFLC